MSCGARFYDLNKKPIICPTCNVEFTGEIKVKSRRGRLPSELADKEADDDAPILEAVDEVETEEVESDEETVSLDEIEEDGDDVDEDAIVLDEEEILDDDLDDIDDDDIEEDIAEEDDEK
jgi:uncharacterized protein (TIGR02300 family)